MGNSSRGATQLMEELDCLSGLLSQTDPRLEPRGGVGASEASESKAVVLPDKTPLGLVLREPLFSGDLGKKAKGSQVAFEVAEDVIVDGATVIRKGALDVGHLTESEAAGRAGKGAKLVFDFDKVAAADGQTVAVTGLSERRDGVSFRVQSDTSPPPKNLPASASGAYAAGQAAGGLLVMMMIKGFETVVRAGISFDVETKGAITIRTGR